MRKDEAIQALQKLIDKTSQIKDCNDDWSALCAWQKCVQDVILNIFANSQSKIEEFGRISYGSGSLVSYTTDDESQECFDDGINCAKVFLEDLVQKLRAATDDDIRWVV